MTHAAGDCRAAQAGSGIVAPQGLWHCGLRGCADPALERRDFTLYDFDGGVIVRAGHCPQMGDLREEGVPRTYRAASVALRPIVFTGYQDRVGDLPRLPEKLDRHRETLDWIFRFDSDGRPAPAADQVT